MCETCGCGQPGEVVTIRRPGEEDHGDQPGHPPGEHTPAHEHSHGEDPGHGHPHEYSPGEGHGYHHGSGEGRRIAVEEELLAQNNLLAERNRGYFEARGITTLNLISSPGAGKTTLLERTIRDLKSSLTFTVIEGDQQSLRDAERIEATGVPAVQVNTGTGCHLDANMIHRALPKLDPQERSVLFIENVGNLVCPALFDLGEAYKVVIISVTEGDDKPYKYPTIFDAAQICIINKIDLLPYVDFDLERCRKYAREVNHHLTFFETSATTGEGLEEWEGWLSGKVTAS